MKQNVTEKSPKVAHLYQCEQCDYNTSKKYDFTKHLLTIKHKKCENVTLCNQKSQKVSTAFVVTYLLTERLYGYTESYVTKFLTLVKKNINKH